MMVVTRGTNGLGYAQATVQGPGSGRGFPVGLGLAPLGAKLQAAANAAVAAGIAKPNPYALTQGVITQYAKAFRDCISTTVKPQLFDNGMLLLRTEPNTWPMLSYGESIYPCTSENQAKASFRPDLYRAAQDALSQLLAVKEQAPFNAPMPPLGTKERAIVASIAADWLTCVNQWVSLAFFATNVQPRFLCADNATATTTSPLYSPTRTTTASSDPVADDYLASCYALPMEYATTQRSLQATQNYAEASTFAFGPSWMGLYDAGSASGWTTCDFTPQMPQRIKNIRNPGHDVDWIRPTTNFTPGHTAAANAPSDGDLLNRFLDPWFYWNTMFLYADGWAQENFGWHWYNKRAGKDQQGDWWVTGPAGTLRCSVGWAKCIIAKPLTNHVLQAIQWYTNNHVAYWTQKGLSELSAGEVHNYQVAAAKAAVAAKGAVAQQAITRAGGAAMALASANPIALGCVAAGLAVAKGITALVCWRRKKKKAKAVLDMQPLMMRTLVQMPCTYFSAGITLSQEITSVLADIDAGLSEGTVTGKTDAAHQVIQPVDATTGQPVQPAGASASSGTPASQVVQTVQPVTTLTQLAANPATSSPSVSSDAPIRVSNQAAIDAQPTQPSMPTQTQVAAAVNAATVVSPTAPVSAAPAPASPIPWPLIGIAAVGVAVVVSLRRG